ncbi:MAG: hypothetical protein FWE37_05190 [Spirochaetaceae bacterium]|nr:hypothetical protein [Spirochaetaceae bacterium]
MFLTILFGLGVCVFLTIVCITKGAFLDVRSLDVEAVFNKKRRKEKLKERIRFYGIIFLVIFTTLTVLILVFGVNMFE